MADKVAASQENNEGVTEDGIEDAFEVGANTNAYTFILRCVRGFFLDKFVCIFRVTQNIVFFQ